MGFFADDIVSDILRRALDASQRQGGFDEIMALQIEAQVRQDWGGSEPYIARGQDQQRAARDEKINALYWQQGQRDIAVLALRFGLSQKQIRRILGI